MAPYICVAAPPGAPSRHTLGDHGAPVEGWEEELAAGDRMLPTRPIRPVRWRRRGDRPPRRGDVPRGRAAHGRQIIATKDDLGRLVILDRGFENLIGEVRRGTVRRQRVQHRGERLKLHIQIHAIRTVDANQARVQIDAFVMSLAARLRGRSAKVPRIARHEGSVSREDISHELLVLRRGPISLIDMD